MDKCARNKYRATLNKSDFHACSHSNLAVCQTIPVIREMKHRVLTANDKRQNADEYVHLFAE